MIKTIRLSLLLSFISALFSCDTKKEQWTPLWNGKDLEGWSTYLGTVDRQRYDRIGKPVEPLGINSDPLDVFSIAELDGGPALRISGEIFGMLYTDTVYGNYHLKLEMKWGYYKHPLRVQFPANSGVLYHGHGLPGSAFEWMNAHEFQLMHGQMGNYWTIGAVSMEIPSRISDSLWPVYDANANLRRFYPATIPKTNRIDSLAKRRCVRSVNAERSKGEWNTIGLYVLNREAVYLVNGQEVMRLYQSGDKNGKALEAGKIILQSEGSEAFFRNIRIRPITAIPGRVEMGRKLM